MKTINKMYLFVGVFLCFSKSLLILNSYHPFRIMNAKSVTKVFIFILTLFIAEIVSTIAKNYLNFHPGYKDAYTLTAVKMGIILVIYYPVFQLLSGLSEILSKHFFKKTKSALVGGIPGLIIAFLIGLIICYCVFLKLWYHINVFEVLWKKL